MWRDERDRLHDQHAGLWTRVPAIPNSKGLGKSKFCNCRCACQKAAE